MRIRLSIWRHQNEGFGLIITDEYRAKLIFDLPTVCITYYQYARSPEEALLNAINSFLAGTDVEREIHSGYKPQFAGPITFDPTISPEIRDIINKAIDLKTGQDRNRLESDFHNYGPI